MPPVMVVSVKNLTKKYNIYSKRGQKFLELLTFNRRRFHDIKLALDNVSFEVDKGECFGIIGDNGSGKSTILKILAGTSFPTSGQISVDGRISYILDVSTGFNPDFSGKDNIYIKCSLLGMAPEQIDEIYEPIVEFSGLRERIDHPLRTYSTGMIMRLGFSVGVHLEFDVLLVDEILSVGDYLFQKKCINAIRSIIEVGKTVIITSHSMSDISSFSTKLLLLDQGKVAMIGPTDQVVDAYIKDCEERCARQEAPLFKDELFTTCTDIMGNASIRQVRILDGNRVQAVEFSTGAPLTLAIEFAIDQPLENPCIRIQFINKNGLLVLGTNTYRQELDFGIMQGRYEVLVEFEELELLEGEYFVNLGIWPDEWKSYTSKTPLDVSEYEHRIFVNSQRADGVGIIKSNGNWTLNKL